MNNMAIYQYFIGLLVFAMAGWNIHIYIQNLSVWNIIGAFVLIGVGTVNLYLSTK